jgi:hypothetical protein
MEFTFTFDDEGGLSWPNGSDSPALTEAQAGIVATAEGAQAMRAIAAALYQVAEEIRDASYRKAKDD